MPHPIQRWHSLDARSRWRLMGSAAAVRLVHLLLALCGYARTKRLIEYCSRHPRPHNASPSEIADAKKMAILSVIAGRRGPFETSCLRRSLFLYGWLRRRGLRPRLQLGVPPSIAEGKRFEAHAWVELEGVRLLNSDAGYQPFAPS